MATRDTAQPSKGITRRGFLAASAATAVVGCGLDFAFDAEKALAYENSPNHTITFTTCPYCSASCGQRVVVENVTQKVVDIYGDFESPLNSGGLCAKGAGAIQLVNNARRIGAWETLPHPVNDTFAAKPAATAFPDSTSVASWAAAGLVPYGATYTYADGVAYYRRGDEAWNAVPLPEAMKAAATRLTAARNTSFSSANAASLVLAPGVIDGVNYTGLSGLTVVAKADGKYYVSSNGCKVDATTLGTILANLPTTAAQLLAAFDELVWEATDPTKYSTWTFKGRGNAGATLAALGVGANTVDVIRSSSTYYAFVTDVVGQVHRLESTDMMTWSGYKAMGAPVSAGVIDGIKNPAIIKTGNKLQVWSNGVLAGVEVNQLFYSECPDFTAATPTWTTPVAVTHGGSQLTIAQHPYVTFNGATYTMTFVQGGFGIRAGDAPMTAPQTFAAATVLYDGPSNEGNIVAGTNWIMYTQYLTPADLLGWAFGSVNVFKAATYNSKAIAFFGSSHMNNESNYIYRKLVANFGTSNVEHQARI